ncbi:MAG: hypothetical protein U1A27_05755 [Phycisphaerae bacterium]
MLRDTRALVLKAALVGSGALALTAAALRAEPEPTVAPVPFKPVATVEHLMEGQEMAFKSLKAAVLGSKWRDARSSAWLLAELANVNRQHARTPRYAELSGKMVDACIAVAEQIKPRQADADAAKKGVSEIAATCKSCHDEFRKKRR